MNIAATTFVISFAFVSIRNDFTYIFTSQVLLGHQAIGTHLFDILE